MGYWLYIKPDEAGKYKKNGHKIEQTRTGTYKVWMEGDNKKFGIKNVLGKVEHIDRTDVLFELQNHLDNIINNDIDNIDKIINSFNKFKDIIKDLRKNEIINKNQEHNILLRVRKYLREAKGIRLSEFRAKRNTGKMKQNANKVLGNKILNKIEKIDISKILNELEKSDNFIDWEKDYNEKMPESIRQLYEPFKDYFEKYLKSDIDSISIKKEKLTDYAKEVDYTHLTLSIHQDIKNSEKVSKINFKVYDNKIDFIQSHNTYHSDYINFMPNPMYLDEETFNKYKNEQFENFDRKMKYINMDHDKFVSEVKKAIAHNKMFIKTEIDMPFSEKFLDNILEMSKNNEDIKNLLSEFVVEVNKNNNNYEDINEYSNKI